MEEPWMMPTDTQGQELIDNTNSEWTTINKIKGCKFTSKVDTSKYIFLSAGGYCKVNGFGNPACINKGSWGRYWCTKYYDDDDSWYLTFDSSGVGITDSAFTVEERRYHGMSIRPVAPPKPW